MLDLDRYNSRVKECVAGIVKDIQAEAAAAGIEHRASDIYDGDRILKASTSKTPSVRAIRAGYKQQEGAISMASIKFPRVLIYAQKGAGKGRGGVKGSTWQDRYGNTKKTNPASKGKMGTGGRTEKPVMQDPVDQGVEQLATIAAEELGDAIIHDLF